MFENLSSNFKLSPAVVAILITVGAGAVITVFTIASSQSSAVVGGSNAAGSDPTFIQGSDGAQKQATFDMTAPSPTP